MPGNPDASPDMRLTRYAAIFESAVDFAIIATDRDGLISDWNTGAETIFGWSADEMRGEPADRFFTPEDRAQGRIAHEMSRSLEVGRGNDERWHLRRDGSRFWANGEMMPLRDGDGEHIGFLKILRDETAKREDAEKRRIDRDFMDRVLAASDDCIKVLDLDAHLVFMSEGGRRVMEVDDFAAVRGCSWPDFWQGDLHAEARKAVEAARAGHTAQFQGRTNTFKGTAKWWDVRVAPMFDGQGRPEKILAISRDISRERLAANKLAALLELGDRLRDSETSADMAFAAADVLGRTLEVDRAGYASVDLASESLTIERDWTAPGVASLVGTQRLRDYGSYVDDLKKGETVVFADARDDPRTFARADALLAVSARALVNVPAFENNGLAALCFVAQAGVRDWRGQDVDFVREVADRTQAAMQRNRAEDALRRLAASLEAEVSLRTADRNRLWQLSTDIMLVAGFDGVVMAVNPGWEWTLGWTERDLLGRSLFDLIHPDDLEHTVEGAKGLSEGEVLARFENRYRHKDGSCRSISWMAVPGDGLINAVGRDVTAEKEQASALEHAAEALRQSQKMEAVGQLTGGVAHDFNNLLTIIRSSVDFLRRPNLSEDRRKRYMDAVSDTVERAAKLTSQLLAFSRRQALKPEVFEVGARLTAIADMLDTVTGARVRVVTELPNEPCHVRADVSQFETAVVNMAVNARDAMDGEGTITLRLDCSRTMPAIRGHAGGFGAFAVVRVTDTGTGIAPDQLVRIFEPFFTTKEVGKGTGLGLSQVFGFAKQSGGDIDVQSELGRGTTFLLYLPEVEAQTERFDADDTHGPGPAGDGRRVLVVEDNVEVGRFATQILEDLGYETAWAANAEEALEKLGQDGDGFDIVFSDVVMPGIGGVALARELRRRLPRMPVVLASGYSHVLAEDSDHGFELLQKPYSADQLSKVLRRLIGTRRNAVSRAEVSRS